MYRSDKDGNDIPAETHTSAVPGPTPENKGKVISIRYDM